MEKFGIFALLDALAAMTESAAAEKSAAPAPAPENAAFQPPAYSAPQTDESPSPKTSALNAFLAKHNAVSDKADRN